ncbi:hypothetical protein EC844_101184 [Acinetobacter calcoaceticus]|uniref:Uncharacterized protein n=1 Tax=Acinetobacter calcoaceticus TaxID=471 RepID=A0A4R1Y6R0_ACICA|nr:hypothetical protein EC844_101184 [Acinetobacter calcoaceticus]
MENSALTLLLEIKRVGFSQKWNSSKFFEGPMRIHVLKDGTSSNRGIYSLSKNTLGYPVAIKVHGFDDPEGKINFVVASGSRAILPLTINVPIKSLADHNFTYKGAELLGSESTLYSPIHKINKLYIHHFSVKEGSQQAIYHFYTEDEKLNNELKFVRLVVDFN